MPGVNSPLFILQASKEFFENGINYASKYLKINNEGNPPPFDGEIHSKLCVPATNIAFSLELAFKGLLLSSGIQKHGHDLEKLYNALNPQIREKILVHYKSHNTYNKFVAIRFRTKDASEHGKSEVITRPSSDDDFVKYMLKTHKFAFINFRYMFEVAPEDEWYFYFNEFSNYVFSALFILGETIGIQVVSVFKKKS